MGDKVKTLNKIRFDLNFLKGTTIPLAFKWAHPCFLSEVTSHREYVILLVLAGKCAHLFPLGTHLITVWTFKIKL